MPLAEAAAPLSFTETTAAAGFNYKGASWAVAWGDANGDALPDLYFSNHGGARNLFFNTGNGTFREPPAGVFNRVDGDLHGAAWADLDNDGDQDLIQLVGADRGTATKSNFLYINENGVFNNRAGERGVSDPMGRGRTPLWFDWNRDGQLDLLALNADRIEGPSVLFNNVSGFFSRTNATTDVTGFTKYPVFGSLQAGKRHVIVNGQPFPKRVYDANQTSPLPLTDRRSELDIPYIADMVADTVLFDANGDGVDDILAIKGRLTSDAEIGGGDAHARLMTEDAGGTGGFRFSATAPLTVRIAPLWASWWAPQDVYIGRTGWNPTAIPFQLSTTAANVEGLATPTTAKGIYIGYDRAAGKWEVRLVATAHEEVNILIDGGTISGMQTVGFQKFVRMTPALFNSNNGQYDDATVASGLAEPSAAMHCFSATAADFDNDGDVDIFSACSGPIGKEGIENLLLRNDGTGRFTVVPQAAGVTREPVGIADGVAAADYDLDGFVDLALTNGQGLYPFNDGPTQLFRNTSRRSGNANHWIEIDLRGVTSNRDGVGAQVRLTAGGRTQTRLQRNGVHNGSQDFTRIHFGLGASTSIGTIEVEWPSGARQTLSNIAADQVLRIVEGRSTNAPFQLQPTSAGLGSQTIYSQGTARRFTLTNSSKTSLTLKSVQLIGDNAAQFVMTKSCGRALAALASCTIDVAFKPTAVGFKSAQLFVVAGDKYVETANLTGTGVLAQFTLTPTSLAFGNVAVGVASAARNVTVTNAGADVLPIRSVGIEGTNPGQFAATKRCPDYVVVGQSCLVSVALKPTSKGYKSAQLVVSPGTSGSRRSAGVSGTGT